VTEKRWKEVDGEEMKGEVLAVKLTSMKRGYADVKPIDMDLVEKTTIREDKEPKGWWTSG
jgi:hypothetical protein